MNPFHQFEPIHFRHLDVGQNQAERSAPLHAVPHKRQRLSSTGRGRRQHPPASQHIHQNAPVDEIVVDDQRQHPRQRNRIRQICNLTCFT